MPKRRKEELSEPFDYDRAYDEVTLAMASLHIARISELPSIDLYLDQVLSLVSRELAPLYQPDEKIVTGSMINNYVKQGVVPRPVRKRYNRRHVSTIILVCVLKRTLSIAQIAQAARLVEDAGADLAAAYDQLVSVLEQALASRFPASPRIMPTRETPQVTLVDQTGAPIEGQVVALLESSISLVADKVYVDKLLDLEAQREDTQQHAALS